MDCYALNFNNIVTKKHPVGKATAAGGGSKPRTLRLGFIVPPALLLLNLGNLVPVDHGHKFSIAGKTVNGIDTPVFNRGPNSFPARR